MNVEPGGRSRATHAASAGFVGSRVQQREVRRSRRSCRGSRAGSGRRSGSSTRRRSRRSRTSSTTTEPRRPASASAASCCACTRHREHDVAARVLAAEEVAEVVDRDVEVAADELVVVLRFDAGVAEVHGLVADDVREQRRGLGRIDADLLEVVVGRHRLARARRRRTVRMSPRGASSRGGTRGCCPGRSSRSSARTIWR